MQIAVSSWSFHKPLYEGQLRLWDVPAAARALGFTLVDLQDMFLWPYGNRLFWKLRRIASASNPAPEGRFYDSDLIHRVRQALQQANVGIVAWNCDPELGRPNYVPDVKDYIRQALETASSFSAPILRITMDHVAVGSNITPIIDTLAGLTIDAERTGVRMALENHGYAASVDQMLDIVQAVNSKCLAICLDFGNLRKGHEPEDFEALAPYAIHAHAKSREFDPSGEETTISYQHRLQALTAVNYEGVISIEYEGDNDPAQNILRTAALIKRYR